MTEAPFVNGYLKKIRRYCWYDNAFFRGQASVFPDIRPSISRNKGFINNEHSIYEDTLNQKSDDFANIKQPFAQLAKMQHYGFPTRLIDFTMEPLHALYFAVDKVDNDDDGEVFIFIKTVFQATDIPVKLLSLLPQLVTFNIDELQDLYFRVYSESIEKKDINKYITQNIFIELEETEAGKNERLHAQKGAFAICGYDKKTEGEIKVISRLDAAFIHRIPYEYKEVFKKELDKYFGINESKMYPELPAHAKYICEKYRIDDDLDVSEKYKVLDYADTSIPVAKRVSIEIILLSKLLIDQIKQIVRREIDLNKKKWDVIYLYIAQSDEDLVTKNWLVRAQWVNMELDKRFRPIPFGEYDQDNISWVYSQEYASRRDYYNEHVFGEDKTLLLYNQKTFNRLKEIYQTLSNGLKREDLYEFKELVEEHRKDIREVTRIFDSLGLSRNKNFDDYLENYQRASSSLHSILIIIENEKQKNSWKLMHLKSILNDINETIGIIETEIIEWEYKLGITKDEYDKIDIQAKQKNMPSFKPTIAINKNGLDINFDICIEKYENCTFRVKGSTNLFSNPTLLLTIKDSTDQIYGQDKVEVINHKFVSSVFSIKGIGYEKGDYILELVLGYASTQPDEFVRQAGVEYENLIGRNVGRDGIRPIVKHVQEFSI